MVPLLETAILVILIMMFMSGFFSGSETALTAANRSRIHHLEIEGNRRARLVVRLMEDREHLIGAILLGNNMVNIFAATLAGYAFSQVFGEAGVIYATIVMTAGAWSSPRCCPRPTRSATPRHSRSPSPRP